MTFRTCVRSIASWGVSKGIKGDHAAKMEAHSLPLCCRPSKSLKKSEAESRTWEIDHGKPNCRDAGGHILILIFYIFTRIDAILYSSRSFFGYHRKSNKMGVSENGLESIPNDNFSYEERYGSWGFQPVALRLSQHFQRHKSVSHFASQNLPSPNMFPPRCFWKKTREPTACPYIAKVLVHHVRLDRALLQWITAC